MNKLLAISMRIDAANPHGEARDALAHDWWPFIRASLPEMCPLLLPNDVASIRTLLDRTDPAGLLLTGGNDVGSCPERDESEASALAWMLERKRPVLGVCRGMQFLVHRLGGRLEPVPRASHTGARHGITLAARLPYGLTRHGAPEETNSFHGWQAKPPAHGPLETWATAADGTVEAVYARELSLLGIMWHPERERPYHAFDLALFARHLSPSGGNP